MSQSLVTLKQLFKTMGSKTSNCFHKAPEKVYVVDQEDEKTQREKDLIRQMKVLRTELKMEKIERERAQVDAKEAKEEVMRLKQEFQEELLRKVAEVQTAPRSPALSRIASAEECSFKVQGGVMISLIEDGQEGTEKIFLKSGKSSPFPFRLTVFISKNAAGSEGYIHFDGEVNMFLKMMVEKPLTNLFNYMSKKMQEQFS